MEYLIVRFSEPRNVRIDGVPQGTTNVVLELEAGAHDVTLAPPQNFSPPRHTVQLQNTAALAPAEVVFQLLPPAASPPSPGRPG
jgi:hypothetical protein